MEFRNVKNKQIRAGTPLIRLVIRLIWHRRIKIELGSAAWAMPQISYPNKQLILNYNVEVWFDEVNRCDETDRGD